MTTWGSLFCFFLVNSRQKFKVIHAYRVNKETIKTSSKSTHALYTLHSTHRSNPGAPRTNCSFWSVPPFSLFSFWFTIRALLKSNKSQSKKTKNGETITNLTNLLHLKSTPSIANLLCFFLVDSRWIVLIHPSLGHSQQKNKEDRLSSVVTLVLCLDYTVTNGYMKIKLASSDTSFFTQCGEAVFFVFFRLTRGEFIQILFSPAQSTKKQ